MNTQEDTETESIVEEFLDSNVINQTDDDSISLSRDFLNAKKEIQRGLESDRKDITGILDVESVDEVQALIENWNSTYELEIDDIEAFTVRTLAIHQINRSWDLTRCVRVALALRRFDEEPVSHGAPDGFVPINYNEIELFLQSQPVSVIYVWGDDCEPCEVVRGDLETLVEEGKIPDGVGLAAVYAPQGGELIREKFEVKFIPTLLFCANGRVDSRLLGKPYPKQIMGEIEIISENLA